MCRKHMANENLKLNSDYEIVYRDGYGYKTILLVENQVGCILSFNENSER